MVCLVVLEDMGHGFLAGKVPSSMAEGQAGWHCANMMISMVCGTLKAQHCDNYCPLKPLCGVGETQQSLLSPVSCKGWRQLCLT